MSAHIVGIQRAVSVLEGTKAIVTEFAADATISDKPTYLLAPIYENGLLTGYRIAGDGSDLRADLPDLRAMRLMEFPDKSDLNLTRGCGLIEVFRSVGGAHNINQGYGVSNALYDACVSRRAERGEKPLDPFNTFSDTPDAAGAVSWIANQRTFLKARPEMATSLPADEVVEAKADDIVAAEHAEDHGDHARLFGVRLNGAPLPKPCWFIYAAAWDRLDGHKSA